jgi:hypothetical protein
VIDLITVRGTGEPHQGANNLLTHVTALLDPAKFGFLADLDYPASIGVANHTFAITGPSEEQSLTVGVVALAQLIRTTPNTVGILGYSLGAEVVSRFMEAKGRGEYPDCKVAFSACIANPLRVQGTGRRHAVASR